MWKCSSILGTSQLYRHFLFLGITKIYGKINVLFHSGSPPSHRATGWPYYTPGKANCPYVRLKLGGPPPPIRLRPGMVQWTCISGRSKLGRSKRGRNGVERGEVCPPPDRNGLEEQNTKDEKTVSCPVGRFTVLFCPQTREEKRL